VRTVKKSRDEYGRRPRRVFGWWHHGKNDTLPWRNYFLNLPPAAYKEFEPRVESGSVRPVKSDLLRRTVLAEVEEFTLADLAAQIPTASRQLIKKVLATLKRSGQVRLVGRSVRWRLNESGSRARHCANVAVRPGLRDTQPSCYDGWF
jgi:hypothetical protein